MTERPRLCTGPNRDSILALFGCLALCPEDTSPPLEVIRIMFEAVQDGAGPGAEARPTLLNIRRWLKVPINQGSSFSSSFPANVDVTRNRGSVCSSGQSLGDCR